MDIGLMQCELITAVVLRGVTVYDHIYELSERLKSFVCFFMYLTLGVAQNTDFRLRALLQILFCYP